MIEFVVTHVGLDALTPEQIDEGVRRLADTVSEVRG
jgi:hypothetical protein